MHLGARDAGWFPNGDGRFVEEARLQAARSLTGLVSVDETTCFPWGLGVYLRDIPTGRFRVASSCLLVYHELQSRRLLAGWGTGDPSEHSLSDPESVVLTNGETSDEERARAAVTWLAEQLMRPIECRTWVRLGMTFRQCVLVDTDTELSRIGHPRLVGADRWPPTSVARLRPRHVAQE
jgi:hypothetical protein